MALLGALAVNALQNRGASGSTPSAAFAANVPANQIRAATAADTEKLIVKAMISAAKADGTIDQREMERIAGKVDSEGVSPEERQHDRNTGYCLNKASMMRQSATRPPRH